MKHCTAQCVILLAGGLVPLWSCVTGPDQPGPFGTCRFCCRNTAHQSGWSIRKIFLSDRSLFYTQFPPAHFWVHDDPCLILFTRKTAEHALFCPARCGRVSDMIWEPGGRVGVPGKQGPSKGHGHPYGHPHSVSHTPCPGPVPDSVLLFCKMFLRSPNTFWSFSSKWCDVLDVAQISRASSHTVSLTRPVQWIHSFCKDSERVREWAGI